MAWNDWEGRRTRVLGDQFSAPSLIRVELTAALEAGKHALAKRVKFDGQEAEETDQFPIGDEVVTVYDWTGNLTGASGDRFWAIFRPDSQRWELIAGAGDSGEQFKGTLNSILAASDASYMVTVTRSSTGKYSVGQVITVQNDPDADLFEGVAGAAMQGYYSPFDDTNQTTWVECPPPDPAATPAAAGSTQADATAVTSPWNAASGADGTKGVKLPTPSAAQTATIKIYNNSASALKAYPHSGGDINDGTTDAAVTVAAHSVATFTSVDATTWAQD